MANRTNRGSASPGMGNDSNLVLTPYPRTPATFDGRGTNRRGPRGSRGPSDYFNTRDVRNANTVKMASESDIQLLSTENILPPEIQFSLVFEDIGGQEILNVSRHDLINGQNIIYQPIRNASKIAQQFSSRNLVELGITSEEYFNGFKLRFEDYIPTVGNGPNGEYVYLDDQGNVIIDVINILDEEVEVQLVSNAENTYTTDYFEGAES